MQRSRRHQVSVGNTRLLMPVAYLVNIRTTGRTGGVLADLAFAHFVDAVVEAIGHLVARGLDTRVVCRGGVACPSWDTHEHTCPCSHRMSQPRTACPCHMHHSTCSTCSGHGSVKPSGPTCSHCPESTTPPRCTRMGNDAHTYQSRSSTAAHLPTCRHRMRSSCSSSWVVSQPISVRSTP